MSETWFTGKVIAEGIARECSIRHGHGPAGEAFRKDWARKIDDAVEHGRRHALDEAMSIVNKRLAHPEMDRNSVSDIFDDIEALKNKGTT